eukprot:2685365-Karenia_brevis.AAC.1
MRRIADRGESTNENLNIVLLDWEKAFDRVHHTKLIEAMKRMKLHPKIVKSIENMYKSAHFFVEANGVKSSDKQQKRGIRQ